MLKKRIIPTLLLKEGRLYKGKNFSNYRDVGDPASVLKIYSNQYADELILINIGSTEHDFNFLLKILSKATENCFIPITAGGGIDNLDKAKKLFNNGADKVLVTSEIASDIKILEKISLEYGRQAVIAGIDILENSNTFKIVKDKKRTELKIPIEKYVKEIDSVGAGEILFNFVNRDGMLKGLNIKLLNYLSKLTKTPTICLGGIGNLLHMCDIFKNTSCDAIACSSVFHFGDNNPIRARSYLKNNGVNQRIIK